MATCLAAGITPVMITGMFLFFPLPAGVLLYMVGANIFQAVQTFLLTREALPDNLQAILDQQLAAEAKTVMATVSGSAACGLIVMPFFEAISRPIETTSELVIATTSHHAFTRHQNQRTRYNSPVPAPICRITPNASRAVSIRYTVADEAKNRPTVTTRPTWT